MFFSVITKKLNCEFLNKNFVTFKRWDGVKDEKFYYYGDTLENLIFGGGHKKPIYRGEIIKKRKVWTVFSSYFLTTEAEVHLLLIYFLRFITISV